MKGVVFKSFILGTYYGLSKKTRLANLYEFYILFSHRGFGSQLLN